MPKSPMRKSQRSKSASPKRTLKVSPSKSKKVKSVSPKRVLSKRVSPKRTSPKRASPKKLLKRLPKKLVKQAPALPAVVPAPVVEADSGYSTWYALIGLLVIVGLALLGYFLFLRLRPQTPKFGLFTKSGKFLAPLKKEDDLKDEKVEAHKLSADEVLVFVPESDKSKVRKNVNPTEGVWDSSIELNTPYEIKVSELGLKKDTDSKLVIFESTEKDAEEKKPTATFIYKLKLA